MTQNDFFNQQRAAVERMREMKNRSSINNKSQTPNTPFDGIKPGNPAKTSNTDESKEKNKINHYNSANENLKNNSLQIPLLDKFLKDKDAVLIIGLLLILMSENADKMLIFALIYILI